MRDKEKYDQAPEDFVKQACAVIVKPFMARAGVKLK
jgi:hypothetical protein